MSANNVKSEKGINRESIKIVAVLCILALISSLLLAVVNRLTQVDERARYREAVGKFYDSPLTDKEVDISGYRNLEGSRILDVFIAENGGVVIVSDALSAYKGAVLIVIIREGQIEKVISYSSSETPGLGSKATEDDYLNQYTKYTVDDFNISLERGEVGENSVRATPISGATVSVNAVRQAVEGAVAVYLYLDRDGDIDYVDETTLYRQKVEEVYSSALTDYEFDITGFNNFEGSKILGVFLAGDGAVAIISEATNAYREATLIVIIKDDKIEKVTTYSSSETPNFGGKVMNDEYLEQYTRYSVGDFNISLERGEVGENNVEAEHVSRATISVNAAKEAVEGAVAVYLYLNQRGMING